MQKRPFSCPPCLCGKGQTWPSCPSGRLGKSGPGPSSGKGPPPRVVECCQVGPKWLIVMGSPGRGLKIAIFWVSACSVVRRAFLEPARSSSCKSGLPPALPASVGEARQPGKWPSCPSGRLGKSVPGPPSGQRPPHLQNSTEGERGLLQPPPLLASPPPVGAFRESGSHASPSRTVWSQTPLPRSGRPPSRSGWSPSETPNLLRRAGQPEPDPLPGVEPVKVLGPPVAPGLLKPQVQPLLKIEATGSPGPGHPSSEVADENIAPADIPSPLCKAQDPSQERTTVFSQSRAEGQPTRTDRGSAPLACSPGLDPSLRPDGKHHHNS